MIAIANTPSLNASVRPVDQRSFICAAFDGRPPAPRSSMVDRRERAPPGSRTGPSPPLQAESKHRDDLLRPRTRARGPRRETSCLICPPAPISCSCATRRRTCSTPPASATPPPSSASMSFPSASRSRRPSWRSPASTASRAGRSSRPRSFAVRSSTTATSTGSSPCSPTSPSSPRRPWSTGATTRRGPRRSGTSRCSATTRRGMPGATCREPRRSRRCCSPAALSSTGSPASSRRRSSRRRATATPGLRAP